MTELVTPEWRVFVGVGRDLFWVIGHLYTAAMAYAIRQWRHLQLSLAVPLILNFLVIMYVRLTMASFPVSEL